MSDIQNFFCAIANHLHFVNHTAGKEQNSNFYIGHSIVIPLALHYTLHTMNVCEVSHRVKLNKHKYLYREFHLNKLLVNHFLTKCWTPFIPYMPLLLRQSFQELKYFLAFSCSDFSQASSSLSYQRP